MIASSTRSPIASSAVARHLELAASGLDRANADGLLVFRDTNILAFCGVPLAPSDRLVCGLVNRQGRVALVVPAFEAAMAEGSSAEPKLFAWEEHEDPYAVAATAAQWLGIGAGRLLLDGYTWLDTEARFREALPQAHLAQDPGLIESIRLTKGPTQIETIRSACTDNSAIYREISELLGAGISELELSRDILARAGAQGRSIVGHLIQGGRSASIPHAPPTERKFRDGDAVIVDLVCRREGYHGDMTRTFALGAVSDEVKRAYGVVCSAQRAAFEAVRPGVACEDVDSAARSVIEAAGLGAYFCHRLGHGIGLDVHEPPYLVQGNRQVLEPGMCVTIEPGVYVPGQFGVRIEDVVAVTDAGYDLLSGDTPTDVSDFGRMD